MKTIVLTQGKAALVDDGDFEFLSKFKWHAHKDRHTYYARSRHGGATLRMHRLICGDPEPGFVIDHINGNGLDNRRVNMRAVSANVNALSTKRYCNNTSGYRGVVLDKRRNLYAAQLQVRENGVKRKIHLGYFPTPEEASRAYHAAVKERYGNFYSRAV